MGMGRDSRRGVICLALTLIVLTGSGCRLFRRAPVATPVPPPAETSEEEVVEPDAVETEETQVDVPVEAVPPDPAKADEGPPAAPEEAPPPPTAEAPSKTPPPAEEPPEQKAEPPEPRLIHDEDEVSPESIRSDISRAVRLSDVLADRVLSAELRAQVASGRAFLDDAREALAAEDLKRASVLIDKCLGLLEDAEYNSRR